MKTSTRFRCSLVGMWCLSCVVGWLVRWAGLHFPVLMTGIDVGDVSSFERYSLLEAISRAFQGTVFFLIVSLNALHGTLKDLRKYG